MFCAGELGLQLDCMIIVITEAVQPVIFVTSFLINCLDYNSGSYLSIEMGRLSNSFMPRLLWKRRKNPGIIVQMTIYVQFVCSKLQRARFCMLKDIKVHGKICSITFGLLYQLSVQKLTNKIQRCKINEGTACMPSNFVVSYHSKANEKTS